MKKIISRKNVLKEAGVLLIIAAIIFSSFAIAAEKNTSNNKIFNSSKIDNNNELKIKQITNPTMGRGVVIFSQHPYLPDESWGAYTSASNLNYLCQEDFWGLTDSISDVHWWGFALIWNNGWYIGNPNGMKFEIKFYKDNAGVPGNIVATYSNILPTYTDTGLSYTGFPSYYFETDITSVLLANGWISIQSTFAPDGSSFLWLTSPNGNHNALQNGANLSLNLAFQLTKTAIPKICCNGSLIWDKVKAGSIVSGTFKVCNCGDSGSLLNWAVDSYPSWGTWTFTPSSGTGLAEGNCVDITVFVTAPPQKKTVFTGTVRMTNSENLSDFCEIDVSLTTPRTRAINNPILRFFKDHPLLFRIFHLWFRQLQL